MWQKHSAESPLLFLLASDFMQQHYNIYRYKMLDISVALSGCDTSSHCLNMDCTICI